MAATWPKSMPLLGVHRQKSLKSATEVREARLGQPGSLSGLAWTVRTYQLADLDGDGRAL